MSSAFEQVSDSDGYPSKPLTCSFNRIGYICTVAATTIILLATAILPVRADGRPSRAEISRVIDMLRSRDARAIEQAINSLGRYEDLRYAPLYHALVAAERYINTLPDSAEYRYLELVGWLPAAATRAEAPDLFRRRLYDGVVALGDMGTLKWMYRSSEQLSDSVSRAHALKATARLISELGTGLQIGPADPEYAEIVRMGTEAVRSRGRPYETFSFRSVLRYRSLAVLNVVNAELGGRASEGYELFLYRQESGWAFLSTGQGWIS